MCRQANTLLRQHYIITAIQRNQENNTLFTCSSIIRPADLVSGTNGCAVLAADAAAEVPGNCDAVTPLAEVRVCRGDIERARIVDMPPELVRALPPLPYGLTPPPPTAPTPLLLLPKALLLLPPPRCCICCCRASRMRSVRAAKAAIMLFALPGEGSDP